MQPIIFYKLKRDPAVAAGPLVTAFNDLLGTTLYLVVATAMQAA
ncbi:MAG: magnesium transporter [Deltaproteobacteria bacterium]|nr:magnesium transporter [Deltaproteobacteria bacterium]